MFGANSTSVALTCMQSATGVVAGTQLYYFQGAVYEGVPSYVGAFLSTTGTNPSLVVVAVSIDGCRALNVIYEKL